MHTQAQGILSLPVWAAGHAQENASGRPGASDDKPRTCAHATQEHVSEKEPEHRNQPVPRVAAQSIGLCVAPARNTPGQICTRAKARREANQLAARHEYSISLHRNITSADRFAGKGKIETVFLPLRRTAKIGNISPINASLSSGEAA